MNCWRCLVAALLPLVLAGAALARDAEEEAQFAAQVKRLAPTTPKSERLEAVGWLLRHCARPPAARAIPALERCLKHDPDAAVRMKAAEALGMTAYQIRPRVCPVALLDGLLDPNPEVRGVTAGVAGMFREFAPGSVDVLLRCARAKEPSTRATAIALLGVAGAKDAKAVAVIRAARDDPHFLVRHDAHAALFRVTGKLEDIVPYGLRVQAEFLGEPEELPKDAPEEVKRERAQKNLVVLGAYMHLADLGEEYPEPVAKLVLEHLGHESALVRRGAAVFVGRLPAWPRSVKGPPGFLTPSEPWSVKGPPRYLTPSQTWFELLLPYTEKSPVPKVEKKDAPRPNLEVRLRELGVAGRLARLRDADPDRAVRAAAAEALRPLEAGKRK